MSTITSLWERHTSLPSATSNGQFWKELNKALQYHRHTEHSTRGQANELRFMGICNNKMLLFCFTCSSAEQPLLLPPVSIYPRICLCLSANLSLLRKKEEVFTCNCSNLASDARQTARICTGSVCGGAAPAMTLPWHDNAHLQSKHIHSVQLHHGVLGATATAPTLPKHTHGTETQPSNGQHGFCGRGNPKSDWEMTSD